MADRGARPAYDRGATHGPPADREARPAHDRGASHGSGWSSRVLQDCRDTREDQPSDRDERDLRRRIAGPGPLTTEARVMVPAGPHGCLRTVETPVRTSRRSRDERALRTLGGVDVDLLARLVPGVDGEEAFAELDEQVWKLAREPGAPALTRRLVELLSMPGNENRARLVRLVAALAQKRRWIWPPEQDPGLVRELRAAVPVLAGFIAGPDPAVRRVVPHALAEILIDGYSPVGPFHGRSHRDQAGTRLADPAVVAALVEQADDEDDALALAGQLRALDELGPPPASWFAARLRHPGPEVRMAAVAAVARRRPATRGLGEVAARGLDDVAGRGLGEVAARGLGEVAGGGLDEIAARGLGEVAAGALAASGMRAWQGSPWSPGSPVGWLADRLSDHPEDGERLVLEAFASNEADLRHRAPEAAAMLLNRWRRPFPRLWAALAASLADRSVQYRALDVFATAGTAAHAHTAALLAVTDDFRALFTLAAVGEPAVVPALAGWIGAGKFTGFVDLGRGLAPLREQAAELLPAIRAALRRRPHGETDGYLTALAAWGPASRDAVPDLVDLLDSAYARRACTTLGRIGPDAHAAAGTLERLALGRRRPPASRAVEWAGTQHAAWAHWRVTGDPGIALRVLGRALRGGLGRTMLPYLAELGPLAGAHADGVRQLLALPGSWSRVEAAHAWWRITGDPGPALPVLLAALEPLRARRATPEVRAAIGHLAALGCRDLPLVEAVLADDLRWGRTVHDDEALLAVCRAVSGSPGRQA
ncbi:hypothetical protein Aoc01nite_83920 [Actinoplanes octamycinicus]|nr:hypothetical protein Aoc01nite_83920 [Actinoplanes octamycinicus]